MNDTRHEQDCRLECFSDKGETLVLPTGSLNLNNCEHIKERVLAMVNEPCECIYFYLGSLGMIDSSGLGLLVGIHVTARNRKIKFVLLSPNSDQMMLLKTTRLNLIFSILSGVESEQIRSRLEQPAFAL